MGTADVVAAVMCATAVTTFVVLTPRVVRLQMECRRIVADSARRQQTRAAERKAASELRLLRAVLAAVDEGPARTAEIASRSGLPQDTTVKVLDSLRRHCCVAAQGSHARWAVWAVTEVGHRLAAGLQAAET